MNTQKIEIYIGWTDGTWDTAIIDILAGPLGNLVDDFIEQEAMKIGLSTPPVHGEVAFAGMYNKCPIEEEDEE